ncbi:MAG: hypothetical protein K2W81_15160 [Sphingomonas sp.]|uniref:hypothetical protein n=1 Tax=Sphingomonas sp. TaxID=28214 RepID=UPI0025EDA3E1|nr:hypothetical protein [Sphingomonas sp.]MBY0285287.1 hypothetical protein [Sphingomonas sp.]
MIDRVGTPGPNVARNPAATKAALTEATLKALAPSVTANAPEEGVVVALSPQARAAATTSTDPNPTDPRMALAQAAMAQATLAGTSAKAATGPDAIYRANSTPAIHAIPTTPERQASASGIPGPVIRWLALVVLAGVVLWLMLGRGR